TLVSKSSLSMLSIASIIFRLKASPSARIPSSSRLGKIRSASLGEKRIQQIVDFVASVDQVLTNARVVCGRSFNQSFICNDFVQLAVMAVPFCANLREVKLVIKLRWDSPHVLK